MPELRITWLVLMAAACGAPLGCGDDSSSGDAADTPVDGDGGADADGDADTDGDADSGADADGDGTDDAGCTGTGYAATELIGYATAQLRQFFGVTTGFDDGTLYFRDMVSSADLCPAFDQSQVVYAAPLDDSLVPVELRDQPRLALFLFGLNGLPYIMYGIRDADPTLDLAQSMDRIPISFVASFDAGVPATRQAEIVAALAAGRTVARITHLEALGVLTIGPSVDDPEGSAIDGRNRDYWIEVTAIAEAVRATTELMDLTWDGRMWGIPMFQDETRALDAATIVPECERTVTREFLTSGGDFASLPSFPPPLGTGWQENSAPTCSK